MSLVLSALETLGAEVESFEPMGPSACRWRMVDPVQISHMKI